ncbi:MAG: hypothetical protein R3324_20640 [Halobacteriales archaeon]|nr:hypothetical protein [Halobacteriales archaeon]
MREIVSEVAPKPTSRRLTVAFVVLALGLTWISIAFTIEVFGAGNPVVLGTNLATGFAVMALLAVVYYRLFVPHRLVVETGGDAE